MPKFMPDIWFIILVMGPIISRACSGMESSWASFMCSATGVTMRCHAGMVSSNHCLESQALAVPEAVGK